MQRNVPFAYYPMKKNKKKRNAQQQIGASASRITKDLQRNELLKWRIKKINYFEYSRF